jgi:hypothetical protein
MTTPAKPSRHCIFRIPTAELEKARSVARDHGITLTELIRQRLQELPLPDRKVEQSRFAAIHGLTREMQYIGHNINQVTAAIHRANKMNLPIGGEMQRFAVLIESYLASRETLRSLLEKYLHS